jgi:nitroreductase
MTDRTGARRTDQVTRRWFLGATAAGLAGLAAAGRLRGNLWAGSQDVRLPPPIDPGRSLEICLNSRTSHHGTLGGRVTDQQMANVLWAAGRAPVTGSSRVIRVATPDGTFVYRPEDHALVPESSQATGSAFRITYDRERDFDAGVSYTFALTAATAQWSATGPQLATCPVMRDLDFGIATVTGLSTECVAASSDVSLPSPTTDGANSLHRIIETAGIAPRLGLQPELDLAELGQVLWAGYGCSPHRASGGKAGLTVPSWRAEYFLTDTIYAAGSRVWRYRMRRGSDETTRDHALEAVQSADVRAAIEAAVATVPSAACHIVLCLPAASAGQWYAMLETGFAAGGMLLQATALSLGCHVASGLSADQEAALRSVVGIAAGHVPHAIVSLGRSPDGSPTPPEATETATPSAVPTGLTTPPPTATPRPPGGWAVQLPLVQR